MKILIVLVIALLLVGTYMVVAAGGRMLGELKTEMKSVEVGKVQTDLESIELGAAKSVQAEFRIGCGTITLHDGADQLMDARFTYNIPAWKPDVMYGVSAGKGRLVVKQPSSTGNVRGRNRYEWDVRLRNDVPIDLSVHSGVGESNLDIGSLDLASLTVHGGTGERTIKLTGEYPSLSQISLDSGVGDLSLDMTGRFSALKMIGIHSGTGTVDIDLTGRWDRDVAVVIDKGVGATSLRLPNDVGVRVAVDTGVGRISGTGMKMAGEKTFVNDAYDHSKVRLDITVKQGVGEIKLDLVE